MTKNRRTKADKIRAKTNRTIQLKSVVKKVTDFKPLTTLPINSVLKPSTASAQPNFRQRDLRLSLLVLLILVVLQFSLWLVFRTTSLDEHIYNLIKI